MIVIPKASSQDRLRENVDLFDFSLDDEDLQRIAAMDRNGRMGPHPNDM
jgi:2,5-diketo-D-gluconate reductase A